MEQQRLLPRLLINRPKYQIKVEEIESKEEEIKFLEKEELAQFLRITDSDGLEMDSLIFTTLAYIGFRINYESILE
ncbi:hypothetical protein ACIQAA_28495 [Neobacillus sp. NPDC093182]|uniref:hypothetical protein n=1 Tax=Neobacillus sp. NPDC093182 TaxID=3364297 RepID=UPI00382858A3